MKHHVQIRLIQSMICLCICPSTLFQSSVVIQMNWLFKNSNWREWFAYESVILSLENVPRILIFWPLNSSFLNRGFKRLGNTVHKSWGELLCCLCRFWILKDILSIVIAWNIDLFHAGIENINEMHALLFFPCPLVGSKWLFTRLMQWTTENQL